MLITEIMPLIINKAQINIIIATITMTSQPNAVNKKLSPCISKTFLVFIYYGRYGSRTHCPALPTELTVNQLNSVGLEPTTLSYQRLTNRPPSKFYLPVSRKPTTCLSLLRRLVSKAQNKNPIAVRSRSLSATNKPFYLQQVL